MSSAASPFITLNTGAKMPTVGMGLWKISNSTVADQVYQAIKLGYRLFDGACDYGNETEAGKGISRAISDGLVTRQDLFITSKLWCTYHKREHVKPALQRTLSDLKLDYVDLYLVHFPIALEYVPFDKKYPPEWSLEKNGPVVQANVPYRETWEAMEELVTEGLAKNIGISNMSGAMIYDLLTYARVRPAVLQIEMHPYLVRKELVDLAHSEGIAVTAFSSFGDASYLEIDMVPKDQQIVPLLKHDVVGRISKRVGKTPAQVLLRWAVQRGCAVIPKSSNPERLLENKDLFGFELSSEDMEDISGLDRKLIFNNPAIYAKRAIWAS
ncbi:D-xylose reductase [Coemansia erecta]|uniref:D-xylose reductase n=1 Tax=Coemansia asiatica TaxID=1052880 RepID=A0A9W7XMG6_9FUNG|nr:D-xylose reductase [Coemansia asiatica]KAJ2856010.1 D-xylose reductase [Coemansia erecta]